MPTKICSSCSTEKDVAEFHAARRPRGGRPLRGGHGVAAICKVCTAEKRRPGIAAERRAKAMLAASGLKVCSSCRETKTFAEFNVRRASPDGRCYKCASCSADALTKWREENPDAFQRWYAVNGERHKANFRRWRSENKDRVADAIALWAKENRHRVNANNAKRIAIKFKATPQWADMAAIERIYAEAARLTEETGVRHEVDHIYPLQGKTVCGLHCEANLQILTKEENIRKLNRMPEELGYA